MSRILLAIAVVAWLPAVMVPAAADGALAVGSTANVTKDGIAFGTAINYKSDNEANSTALKFCTDYKQAPRAAKLCQVIATFKDECYAISMDPKAGTPGAGWAIAPTKAQAQARALAHCKVTAGSDRQNFCQIDESKCDGKAQ